MMPKLPKKGNIFPPGERAAGRFLPGLGEEFLNEIERATDRMAVYPEAGVRIRGETRRRMLRRFPFGLLYRIEEEQIVVTAVMHLHRKPGYWEDRV